MADFERDTAIAAAGEGSFDCEIHEAWWVVAGPNGGYLAAMIVRALEAVVPEDRPLRSVTIHYLRAPVAGPAVIRTEAVREGRSVSFMGATLEQDGKAQATAVAVFAADRSGIELDHVAAPDIPPPDEVDEPAGPVEASPPFRENFHFRQAIGDRPFSGADEAVAGGWLRPRDSSPDLDAALVVAMSDAWFPPVFSLVEAPIVVPTLDLTVHLRAPLPRPSDWVLGSFWTRRVRDGFFEEDGELFTRDGELLAQSRQLAIIV